ncbi:MAG TPA: polyphosphate kinase [Saprospiraceae bacterium]|nr:polyphosphate kinase [Saprospiraceae bacterium]
MPPPAVDEETIKEQTEQWVEAIGDLQEILYAQKKYSLLVIFQGMDGSGKDGAVKKVFKECHPNGLSVYSFKKPTEQEFAHDFLWRVHQRVPEKGMIQIFNRSHYEDILIQRVHGWIDDERVANRMRAINAFEHLLQSENNTLILKFFLHISYEQQEQELLERQHEKDKFWKHNDNDWKERQHWPEYRRCYEYAIHHSEIPWVIVPVDKRWYRDYIVARTLLETLRSLPLEYPPLITSK